MMRKNKKNGRTFNDEDVDIDERGDAAADARLNELEQLQQDLDDEGREL